MGVFVLSVYTPHEGLCHMGVVKINPKYLPSFVIIQMDICITTKTPKPLCKLVSMGTFSLYKVLKEKKVISILKW